MSAEDMVPILIALAVVAFASYRSAQKARLRKAAGITSDVPVTRRRYHFLFHRDGKAVIPVFTIGISLLLVLSYFTVGSPHDSTQLIVKEMRARHLFTNSVDAGLLACGESAESFCETNLAALKDLQIRITENRDLKPSDLKLMSKGLIFYDSWSRDHAQNTEFEQKLEDDQKQIDEVIKSVEKNSDNTLSRENFSLKTVVLSQISHADLSHLSNNLFAFIFFGSIVEGWLGSALYLFVYICGGTLAMIAYVKFFAAPDVHVLGASANISSVIAGYAFFRVKEGFTQLKNLTQSIAMSFYFFYYLFGQDVAGVARGSHGIAFGAHLLGASVGFLILLLTGTPSTDNGTTVTQTPKPTSTPQGSDPVRDFRAPIK